MSKKTTGELLRERLEQDRAGQFVVGMIGAAILLFIVGFYLMALLAH